MSPLRHPLQVLALSLAILAPTTHVHAFSSARLHPNLETRVSNPDDRDIAWLQSAFVQRTQRIGFNSTQSECAVGSVVYRPNPRASYTCLPPLAANESDVTQAAREIVSNLSLDWQTFGSQALSCVAAVSLLGEATLNLQYHYAQYELGAISEQRVLGHLFPSPIRRFLENSRNEAITDSALQAQAATQRESGFSMEIQRASAGESPFPSRNSIEGAPLHSRIPTRLAHLPITAFHLRYRLSMNSIDPENDACFSTFAKYHQSKLSQLPPGATDVGVITQIDFGTAARVTLSDAEFDRDDRAWRGDVESVDLAYSGVGLPDALEDAANELHGMTANLNNAVSDLPLRLPGARALRAHILKIR